MDDLRFTVDTQLFRELGELLVGRDSTALIELIKNSYDADATTVTVTASGLDDPSTGFIEVTDDGVGMTAQQFQVGFLRIASRAKTGGERRSLRYGRRFTGEKGIGRLAAHKLARHITIESFSSAEKGKRVGILAEIDWNMIESRETLDQLVGLDAITLREISGPQAGGTGTRLLLRNLRRKWTDRERSRFIQEVSNFSPPPALVTPPEGIAREGHLFQTAKVRDAPTDGDPGISVELGGHFLGGEDYWQNLASACSWVVEIDAKRPEPGENAVVHFKVSPTTHATKSNPSIVGGEASVAHPHPESGPFFQARIMVREGSVSAAIPKSWLAEAAGVRVYLEGFRVLPYGDRGDDWLTLDRDYRNRSKTLALGADAFGIPSDPNEGLLRLSNQAYLGAVFLTSNDAPTLKMLVNREGFVPEQGFYSLVDLLKSALDFATRIRAREGASAREARRIRRESGTAARVVGRERQELSRAVEDAVADAAAFSSEARSAASRGDIRSATNLVNSAATMFAKASELSGRLTSERSTMFVLASVGTQMAAFVHETRSMLSLATSIERALESLAAEEDLSHSFKKLIRSEISHTVDLRRTLERQVSFFAEIGGVDSRRRRSPQAVRDRFQGALRYVHYASMRKSVTILNHVPHELRTPPMFPAELSAIMLNLLSNAVKAAEEGGQVVGSGGLRAGRVVVSIENTGQRVAMSEAEKWFKPYESSLPSADATLGQGMGMGLPITRSMLEEYGATISFVPPSEGFSTAIEITF